MEKFNASDIGRIVSPGRVRPCGDIGIWQSIYYESYTLLPDNNQYTKDPQQDDEGMWYIPSGYDIKSESVFLNPYNEITENKYLKGNSEGIGYKTKKEFYHYWYPGFYAWYTDMYIKTPDIYLLFFGYFRSKPKVTQDKLFVIDIDCIGTPNIIKIKGYDEVKTLPELNISIFMSDKPVWGGEDDLKKYEYKIDDISDGFSGTITIDLWNEIVKDNPTYKYLTIVAIGLGIPSITDHLWGYSDLRIEETFTVGTLTLNRLDNIGLIILE